MALSNTHLRSIAVALVLVCAPCSGGIVDTGGVRQVRQSHHLLSHSVISVPSHQLLRLVVR